MGLAALAAPGAQQEDQRLLQARVPGPACGLLMLGGGGTLGEALQGQVIPGLGADVEQREAQLPEAAQLLRGLLQEVPRGGIGADAPEPGEGRGEGAENGLPVVEVHGQRVAVRHEDVPHLVREAGSGLGDVSEHRVQRPHLEGLGAIHGAVGAGVPRAPQRGLEDEGLGLAGRPEEGLGVAHPGPRVRR